VRDSRLEIINKRFENINKVIAVSGGKGGIGKSLTASALALVLKESGYRVGLFDMDFSSPSAHVILGAGEMYPEEDKGIIPPRISGIEFMSIVFYTRNKPLPIRGADISNALIELLTITRWGPLDFLIIDMPPGISDVTLDVIRLLKKIQFLIVSTQSRVVLETVDKVVKMLQISNIPIIGVIENMKITKSSVVENEAKKFNLPVLSEIDFDKKLENSLGDVDKILKTDFAAKVKKIVKRL
jgi:ATP-binding protein involved in chromosome partitioning